MCFYVCSLLSFAFAVYYNVDVPHSYGIGVGQSYGIGVGHSYMGGVGHTCICGVGHTELSNTRERLMYLLVNKKMNLL